MKRTDSYKPRQLPMCAWCFDFLKKAHKKYCSQYCEDAAKAWRQDAYWRKFGQSIAKKDKQVHYESTILGEEDGEYPLDGYPI